MDRFDMVFGLYTNVLWKEYFLISRRILLSHIKMMNFFSDIFLTDLKHMRTVFQRLRGELKSKPERARRHNRPQAHTCSVSRAERRIKIKARKSSPSQKRVNYFERVISEKGYQIDQRDTKAATEPTHKKPRSTSDVSSLFDLLACYR